MLYNDKFYDSVRPNLTNMVFFTLRYRCFEYKYLKNVCNVVDTISNQSYRSHFLLVNGSCNYSFRNFINTNKISKL